MDLAVSGRNLKVFIKGRSAEIIKISAREPFKESLRLLVCTTCTVIGKWECNELLRGNEIQCTIWILKTRSVAMVPTRQ
jgi:hypothetical protein